MMKRTLLLALLLAFGTLINGQTQGFKIRQKSAAGTTKPNLKFRQMVNAPLKSTSPFRYATNQSLFFPGFNQTDKPIVIRKNQSPIYIERGVTPLKSATISSPENRFFAFLEESKAITRVDHPKESYKISSIHTDKLGITHIKATQYYRDIEIYGSESILHLDAQKERYTGSFHLVPGDVPNLPKVDIKQVLQKIQADLEKLTIYRELSPEEKELLQYESPSYSLVIYDKGSRDYVLTWAVTIRPNLIEEWKYFVDATNGGIVRKYNNTNSDGPATGTGTDLNNQNRTFDIVLDNGTYYLYNASEAMYNPATGEGVILTLDANNTSASDLNYSYVTSASTVFSNSNAAISAHCNTALTYEYLYSTFDRNSINGNKGNIISLVNVTEEDGSSMENAFWNGQAAFYGNGGADFKPLAGALDVTAHELGHGVVSNTANLEYTGQSGAINESYADIFGAMVDRTDWKIGEDVTKSSFSPSGALRDMANPHNGGDNTKQYWQPAHVSEMYLGNQDNGGVHINSGIGNYAFYLFATSTSKEKAEQVFYRALSEYLTKTSQFIDWRIAVIQSAKDLYGSGSQEAVKAGEAFDNVGIQEEVVVDDTKDYDANPGQEYLLSYDTNDSDPATLYRSSVTATNFIDLSASQMKGKVSVTDDGSAGVFVANDSKIKIIGLDPSDPYEEYLSDEAFFDNVAVSKDGRRLAAISIEADASIYVYDFTSETWETFVLYNPTTSDAGINAGGVLYADAIEFDITGEYLIYDACNVINSNTVEDIYYWDIGFIRVWNNSTGDFGDGTITKLFSSLPENASVGNPVFSKNSPYIIAFDYFYDDGVDQEYGIFGVNLETGDMGLIFENNTLGYPGYSTNDNRIAFTTLYGTISHEIVATVGLTATKINPSGNATTLIDYAKWPVYYATGDRALGLAPVANFTADYKTGDAPLEVRFMDLSTNNPSSWQWTFQGGNPSSSSLQNPVVNYSSPGTYRVVLKVTNSIGNNTLTREGYIVISGASALDDDETSHLRVYPNPVTDRLIIEYDKDFLIRVYDLRGGLVFTAKNQENIDVSPWRSGMYTLEIETGEGVYRQKVLKQ